MSRFRKTSKQKEANRLLGSNAHNILLYGGSRSGKTLLIVRALAIRAMMTPSTHCVVRRTYKDARQKIALTSFPQMMKMCFPDVPYHINRSDWFIEICGSRIWLAGLDDSERKEHVLGFEFSTVYINECSEVGWDSVQLLRTRLAEKNELTNRLLADCNPPSKRHWTYKVFIEHVQPEDETVKFDSNDWVTMKLNPSDNLENIDEEYIDTLNTLGRRQKKRFLDGDFSEGDEGVLWKREDIDKGRVESCPSDLRRVVVAVDPSGTGKKSSDNCGIVVVAQAADNEYYVLDDKSMVAPPSRWAQEVSEAYHQYLADAVVAETNFGADMVEVVIRSEDSSLNVEKVRASRGKYVRAEPMAALYEQGLVHHVGHLVDLEDELCEFNPEKNKKSPGRLDAVVWGLTFLSEGSSQVIHPRVSGQDVKRKPIDEMSMQEIIDADELWDS